MNKAVALLLILIIVTATGTYIVRPVASSARELEENTWTTKHLMPVTLVRAAEVNGKIYAMEGFFNYEYDPATDNWTAKKPMPTKRLPASFAVAACQGKIYVIGGNGGPKMYTNYLSTNEVYDPSTDMWETKAPMPTSRDWIDANVVNGKIYVIGGVTDSFSSTLTDVNEVYDPSTNSWTARQPAPIAVNSYASAVLDEKIYVMGGLTHDDTYGWQANQIYNVETDTWSLGAALPNSTRHAGAAATTGVLAPKRIYVIGGGFIVGSDSVLVYDPELDNWSPGARMLTGSRSLAVVAANDIIYAMGGASGYQGTFPVGGFLESNRVEQYIPFGYGIVPSVVSPEISKTYVESEVTLTFILLKSASWIGYSLDGNDNVTVTGNVTIAGLSGGLHNLTVYATGATGVTGISKTVTFTVAETFSTVPVAAASVAAVAAVGVIGIGLLIRFRRRKQES